MNKRKGFTLVELLVVIAIIALLMGILLPALARVRRSAKAAACMVQTKQWATVYSMYTGDWDGYFHTDTEEDETVYTRIYWYEQLEPYYKNRTLLLCPSATKARVVNASGVPQAGDEGGKHPEAAFFADSDHSGTYKMSVAINSWLCDLANPPTDPYDPGSYDRPYVNRWITVNRFTQPNIIPLFGDASGYPRIFPQAYTRPPAVVDTIAGDAESGATDGTKDRLMNFCLRRHGALTNPNIDIAFGDFSVRPVGLKALWSLNWHRNWVKDRKEKQSVVEWPEWMEGYSEDGVINY